MNSLYWCIEPVYQLCFDFVYENDIINGFMYLNPKYHGVITNVV